MVRENVRDSGAVRSDANLTFAHWLQDFSQIALRQDLVSIRQKLGCQLGVFV
jgi:hypothetical protein